MIYNADPSNPYAFRSRGQPEVLNGATGTIQVCLSHRGTAQDMSASTLTGTGDTEIDRRLFDPFELQALIQRRTGTVIPHRRFRVRPRKELLDCALCRTLTDDHKIPRLHKPNRPGMVRSGQNPRKDLICNRLSHKVSPDIPPLENYPVDRCPLIIRKYSAADTPHILTHRHDGSMNSACAGVAGLSETSPTSPAPTFVRHVEHKQS
jgi:hypothetical protein